MSAGLNAAVDLGLAASLLRAGGLLAAFAGVGAFSFAVACLPAPALPRLGLSGLQRQRALDDSAAWRSIEPLVRWSGQRLDALLGTTTRRALDRKIALAGGVAGIVAAELLALTIGSALAGGVLAALYALAYGQKAIVAVAGGFVGGLLPHIHLDSLEQERQRRAQLGLPQIIDLVALALSAGLDFPGALRHVVSRSSTPRDALIEELHLVLHQLEIGKTRSEALWLLAERLPAANVREFVAAVVQAERHGSPLAEVLATQAVVSRQRRSEQAEEAATKAATQIILPLMMGFVCVLLLVAAPMLLDLSSKLRGL
ncbi:MAG TPA: type II secretion system F family protein [Polyangiaceae bacterium]|nr:type II secretion system F family protein [Polyangiaceae bacterium]